MPWSPFFEEDRPADPLWSIGPFQIVRCRQSGMVYLANPLSEEELTRFYSVEYFEGEPERKGYASYEADELVLRENSRDLLARLHARLQKERLEPRDLSLLDLGCAYGFFLDEARLRFGHVEGIEINQEVASIGRERFGLTIHAGADALERIGDRQFDAATLWDVIEHVRRPRHALDECRRILKPGGELYLTTGDINSPIARVLGRRWRLINPPQHISYFSIQTMRRLLEETGFEVLGISRCGKRVSLGFIRFILRYLLGRPRPSASRPTGWLDRKSLYVNLFDVMFVAARRRD